MNWDILIAIAEIAGLLAVIGSLIFVGRQFRLQSEQTLQATFIQTAERFSASTETSSVIVRGNRDPECLSPEEKYQYVALMNDMYSSLSMIWEQSHSNLISQRTLNRFMLAATYHFVQPGVQAWLNSPVNGKDRESVEIYDLWERRGFPKEMFEAMEKYAAREFGWKPAIESHNK